jgi:hypothetical protein
MKRNGLKLDYYYQGNNQANFKIYNFKIFAIYMKLM